MTLEDRYCTEVCKGKCCYYKGKKCSKLIDGKCSIHDQWLNNTCNYQKEFKTISMERAKRTGVFPEHLKAGCCYFNEKLFKLVPTGGQNNDLVSCNIDFILVDESKSASTNFPD